MHPYFYVWENGGKGKGYIVFIQVLTFSDAKSQNVGQIMLFVVWGVWLG